MAPPKKKKRLSKADWKSIRKARGEKSAATGGVGAGSRKKFTLPAKWKETNYKSGGRERAQFESPGKSVYKSQKEVERVLVSRNLKDCLNKSCATSEESSQDESAGSEYIPTDEETSKVVDCSVMREKQSKAIERIFFVCETTQLMDLVKQINETSKCSTKDCNGK